jgi:hypothetical protein
MKEFEQRQLPEGLEALAARLRAERAQADPLRLDQIKRRVITRCSTTRRRSTFMKSRIATIATVLGLLGGSGGAIAIAGGGSSGGPIGGAASGQYCNGKFVNHGKCKGHKKHHKHCNKKGRGRGNGKCKGHNKHHGKKHKSKGAVKGVNVNRFAG